MSFYLLQMQYVSQIFAIECFICCLILTVSAGVDDINKVRLIYIQFSHDLVKLTRISRLTLTLPGETISQPVYCAVNIRGAQ